MKDNKNKPSILVADDEQVFRSFVAEILQRAGYSVTEYNPVSSDPELLQKEYDVALLDINMPVKDGFTVSREITQNSPDTQFIIMTAFPDQEKLETAMDLGSFTFLTKPLNGEQIRFAVLGALRAKELFGGQNPPKNPSDWEEMGLIGSSECIKLVRNQIKKLAPMDISVMITGESGTGKEIVANSIHKCSRRSQRTFVPVNCASLSPTLIESELFGHAKGAFTGAIKTKHGLFEAADGGTIFLDEIGELSLDLQAKLLRVLDQKEIRRVGDVESQKIDIRVISATNQNLEEMVEKKEFRQDLYYRLRGVKINLQPLRARLDDIPELVRYFLREKECAVSKTALEHLQKQRWPGNVRELSSIVSLLQEFCKNNKITAELAKSVINEDNSGTGTDPLPFNEYKRVTEKEYFQALIKYTHGNISAASRLSGMHRKNLRDKLKSLGIYEQDDPSNNSAEFHPPVEYNAPPLSH